MNKLALSLAVLMVFSGGAMAKKTTTVNLSPFCDLFTVSTPQKGVVSLSSFNTGCDDGIGIGGIGAVKSLDGKYASVGMVLNGDPTTSWELQLEEPLVTGGAWILSESTDGVTYTELVSGTYIVNKEAPKNAAPASKGHQ